MTLLDRTQAALFEATNAPVAHMHRVSNDGREWAGGLLIDGAVRRFLVQWDAERKSCDVYLRAATVWPSGPAVTA